MEKVIDKYEKDYDPEYPVISFDERSTQLIDHVISPTLPSGEEYILATDIDLSKW